MEKLKFNREFKIGLFGILMLVVLYWGINFLKGTDIFSSTTRYYAVYEQVNGLEKSADIVIKGYKVGKVTAMSYDPRESENVILELAVKSKYLIPDNSTARVFSTGIMSGKSIEIELGNSPKHLLEGDTLFSLASKDFMDVAGSELEFLKQRINDVTLKLGATFDNFNKILTDNSKNINTSLTNIASITTNVDNIVNDEQGSLKEMLRNFNKLSASLKAKTVQIDNIVNNVERFTDSLSASQIPTLVAEMTNTLQALNTTIGHINSGQGTVGKFILDDSLYDSLVVTSSNLSALLDDLQRNPKRYINVTIFGKKNKE